MKKAIVLLVMSLTILPSAALQRTIAYGGYQIGDSNSAVMTGETRITGLPSYVYDSGQQTSRRLTANQVLGQKIICWWAYSSTQNIPATQTTPAHIQYNGRQTVANSTYSFDWTYSTVGYSPAYVVVDYDYIKYNLSYNANGGSGAPSAVNNIIYTNEVGIASGNGLSRNGYTWSGWTNDLTTTVWTGGETVTGSSLGLNSIVDGSNVVLRAQWAPHTYTVKFNKNTSDVVSGTMAPQSMTYDVPANLTSNAFVRTGYKFKGWAVQEDGAKAYDNAQTVANLTDEEGGVVNLYAIWESKKFSIRYHRNDGTDATSVQDNLSYGSLVKIASTTSRVGYTFMGWATSPDGDVDYESGQEYSIDPGDDDVFHLYAVWDPKQYRIRFNSNGGSGTMADAEVEYGEVYVLPECDYTKPGVSFTGWATNLAAAVQFHPGQSVSNLMAKANGVVTFYAIWSEPRYIAFDGNGADDATAMADDVMTFEGVETKTLIPNTFEKTGYTFAGWATNETTAAALNVVYTNYAEVVSTNLWMAIGETNVLFAVWQTNAYTVVFNANGGTGAMDSQSFYYDQAQQLSECIFDASLMFGGWATNETGAAVFDDGALVTNLTSEAGGVVELYATWDNGELSKAMHCDNLFWKSVDPEGGSSWGIAVGAGEGYNPSGSSVTNRLTRPMNQSCDLKPYSAKGSGKLSFWYKTSDNNCWLTMRTGASSEDYIIIDPSTDWVQYGPSNIVDISYVAIEFHRSSGAVSTVWIDQMTWIPAGAEPTDEDKPTINGFAKTTDGFALSVDQTNISDSFSYQILATNELVGGDWPVKETLTADELKAGYEIVIEENEPKMFYKVKVVPKQ